MLQTILDFIISLRWLWIVVIFLGYRIINTLINAVFNIINIKNEIMIRDIDYDEEKILKHLNYIIEEVLTEYVVLYIKAKDPVYINTAMEDEMVAYLSEEVPKRLSKVLLTHLSYIYDKDFIGTYIGKQIYMNVVNYKTNYNIDRDK